MSTITAVGAGAGSGKTHDLALHIANRVVEGQDPAKIVATTFTRKAAAELRARIEARLLAEQRLPAAERIARAKRLELAPIGTVHSVGFSFLQRYSLHLGISPSLQVLEEGASERMLREVLTALPLVDDPQFAEACRRLSIEQPESDALALLQLMRGNRISPDAFRRQMSDCTEQLCALLAPGGTVPHDDPFGALRGLAVRAIEDIGRVGDHTKTTQGAVSDLHRLEARAGTWRDFLSAAKMKAAKAADGLLSDLRAFGAQVRVLRPLHDDLRLYMETLTRFTLELEAQYAEHKRQRGLLDYTDLEIEFLRLLESEHLRDSLRQDIELLVVDEFQDTNPLQLAIFQALRGLVTESRWVGDPKQSIFGFRGADADLMFRVWETIPPESREKLGTNYRSQAGLVEFYNSLFAPVFGEDCRLESHHAPEPRGLDRWLLQATNKEGEFAALAAGVEQLLAEGFQARDVAVLARTKADCRGVAAALDAVGVQCVMEMPGLFRTRECALVLAGLRVTADRYDSLAAATIVHLLDETGEGTPPWIGDRLRAAQERRQQRREIIDAGADGAVVEGETEVDSASVDDGAVDSAPVDAASVPGALPPWPGHPLLDALKELNAALMSPCATLHRVIDVLGLSRLLGRWGEPPRRGGHLDNLLQLAAQYEEEARELGQAATLTGLITRFERLAGDEKDIIVPPQGIQAVTVCTYHGAKGLEWPVVILASLNYARDPDLWTPQVSGGAVDQGEPLKDRQLRFWPWPFGRNEMNGFVLQGSGLEADALATPEGVRISALEEEEAKRLLYVGATRARRKLVLTHRPEKYEWLQLLPDIDRLVSADRGSGEHELPALRTSLVIRELSADMAGAGDRPARTEQVWLADLRGEGGASAAGIARLHNPSRQEAVATGDSAGGAVVDTVVEPLPGPHPFPVVRTEEYQALGNSVHAYLAALPSIAEAPEASRIEIAAHCLRAFEAEGLITPQALVASGERLRAWIESKGARGLMTEIPVTAPRAAGGQWNGTIDLLVDLGDDAVLLIDHKSRPIPGGVAARAATEFTGQMRAYREILEQQGLAVAESWVHFPLAGVMVRVG